MLGSKPLRVVAGMAAVTLLVLALFMVYRMFMVAGLGYIDPGDRTLVDLGQRVYSQSCAVCHGEQLEGQPDWRQRRPDGRLPAPPHDVTGHTWHHPDAVLMDILRNGMQPGVMAPENYLSDMPAYEGFLSEHEMRAVLAYIKSKWPQEALLAQRRATRQYSERNSF